MTSPFKSTVFFCLLIVPTTWYCGYRFGAVPRVARKPAPLAVVQASFIKGAARPTSPVTAGESYASQLAGMFPNTESARLLATVVAFRQERPGVNAEAAHQFSRQLKILHQNPVQTFQDISQTVPLLSRAQASERQFLIQLAGRLDISQREKVNFLSAELLRPVELESDGSAGIAFFNASVALDSLIEATGDPSLIKPLIKRALAAETNADARAVLLSRLKTLPGNPGPDEDL